MKVYIVIKTSGDWFDVVGVYETKQSADSRLYSLNEEYFGYIKEVELEK